MKYGDELEIRLVDPTTERAFYTEPIKLDKSYSNSNFRDACVIFMDNAQDALDDIVSDIEIDTKIKEIPESHLAAALRNRGYKVQKIEESHKCCGGQCCPSMSHYEDIAP